MRENLRPSGEAEPATSRMQPAVRYSGEVHAADGSVSASTVSSTPERARSTGGWAPIVV